MTKTYAPRPATNVDPSTVLPALASLARGILGEGYVPEVPQRMFDTIGRVASEADEKQVLGTLKMMSSRAGALALTGRPTPVPWLSPREAEALIQRWRGSRLPMNRRLGGLMITLALSSLYGYPGPEWERIGYSGPLGPAPDEPKRLHPIDLEAGEVLRCDVVIVGSGAGGGAAAAVLATAGFDVVVVEKGGYRSESDFDHLEADATRDLYLYGMTLATSDLGVRIIAGSTLGGGTVVNYATSFKTPPDVLREWAQVSGIDAFVSGEIEESLDEVAERVGVNTDSSAAGKRDILMEEGLKRLGWHVDQLPRAVRNCTQDEQCGFCGFGCRVGAKQSTMRTFLEDAAAKGTRIIVDAHVSKVVISDGRATGVEGVSMKTGGPFSIEARAVVAAAGAIETPALLLRSGLRGQVGRHLRLHPGSAAYGLFDDEVRVWEGTTQARYSTEFRDWDGGFGPIFETVPAHPGGGSAAVVPWTSAAEHRKAMEKYRNLSFVAALPRDRASGRVRITRTGAPRIDYKLTPGDQRRIAEGVIKAAQVLEAAGATEIRSPHDPAISYRPGSPDAHPLWADRVRAAGLGKGRDTGFSYHQMGSCRMGVDPSSSAIDSENQSHEVSNLFVVDGSTFPTASGVNPMLSIYGIANRAAKKIAARLA
jgi:long-chain-alcohol oxidase